MTKTNAANERIKREYFRYLRQALGRDEATIDAVAKSLARFEEATGGKDFKRFHREQAVAFKAKLAETVNARTGKRLSKATMLATLRDLRAFFVWLSREPGFRSHIAYADADYFNLPDKDIAVARARRERPVPTLDQVRHIIATMPDGTVIERRNRALIAFAMLTGARIGALASFRLGHVNIAGGFVEQDARTVRTKAAKTFRTYFMPVDEDAMAIVADWTKELARDHLWGPDDPLFPATEMGLAPDGGFVPVGLARQLLGVERAGAGDIPRRLRGCWPTLLQSALVPLDAGAPLHGARPLARADEGVVAEPRPRRSADDIDKLRRGAGTPARRVDPIAGGRPKRHRQCKRRTDRRIG